MIRSHTIKPVASSPRVMRKRAASVKTPSELSGPVMSTKRESMAVMAVAGAQVDVSALMGKILISCFLKRVLKGEILRVWVAFNSHDQIGLCPN